MSVMKLSEIEAKPVMRIRTGFSDLDSVYGFSDLPEHNIGMPMGKISLWAGQSGVGKSRLCIEVAKRIFRNYHDGKILYFLTESDMSDFASWAKDTAQYNRIYCSGENKIDEMIKIIYEVRPHIIFIDSVNEIDEFENGNKREARRLINGVDDIPGLKQAANNTGAHIILLGQINQDGKTIKGGTSLPHLVDIALNIVKTDEVGVFRVEVGTKHRYGSTENVALFRHTKDGVIEYEVMRSQPINSQPISSDMQPSMYYHFKYIGKSTPVNRFNENRDYPNYHTIGEELLWQKIVKEKVADGSVKVDENWQVIPKKKGLLTRLNKSVGNMFGLE